MEESKGGVRNCKGILSSWHNLRSAPFAYLHKIIERRNLKESTKAAKQRDERPAKQNEKQEPETNQKTTSNGQRQRCKNKCQLTQL